MSGRLRGDKNQFWDNVAVGINGKSNIVDIGRGTDQITFFAIVSGATTLSVEIAHIGDMTAEGILPEQDDSVFYPLSYITSTSATNYVFAGAGQAAWIIPDIAFLHCRLSSSAAATITAGWQAVGD